MQDRRTKTRYPVSAGYDSLVDGLEDYPLDLSESGVFLRSDFPMPVGSIIDVRFSILVDRLEVIQGIGEVMRVVEGAQSGMGIRFLELDEESEDVLRRFAEHRGGEIYVDEADDLCLAA